MNNNDVNNKLDWMYKSANSLVDREEYLLGRSVDKTLEQLNAEEKEKKLGIVPPKNHVEHECIPPSIRDFNKVVQAEQVDISAKLQEDPLVAIKKREEEARRQFLQNPVQLKKLQDALKAQELKKKKTKRKKSKDDSDSDIDRKIAKKLKFLKGDTLRIPVSKKKKNKSKDNALDTILMHKFNQLKDRLSQEDLNDILAGKISDSDEDTDRYGKKHKNSRSSSDEESNYKQNKLDTDEKRRRNFRGEREVKRKSNRRRTGSSSSLSSDNTTEAEISYKKSKEKSTKNIKQSRRSRDRKKDELSSTDDTSGEESDNLPEKKNSSKLSNKRKTEGEHISASTSENVEQSQKKEVSADFDLETRILQKLRMLRDSSKSRRTESGSESDSEETNAQNHKYESDSDGQSSKPISFGLVKADGTKIALNKKSYEEKKNMKSQKVATVTKPDRRKLKRLTEEEKEEMRREMMKNAEKRDKERSDNLKKYREEDKREEKNAGNFDRDFVHKQLLRSTKEATVESRIKSNLNNIQRSSRHMDTHFSRR